MLDVVRHARNLYSLNNPPIFFRQVTHSDLPFLARLRSSKEDQVSFWQDRISRYLAGTHNPQKALPERIIFIAEVEHKIVGFIAGQLTTRFDCQGELQWLDVAADFRRKMIASKLILNLAEWFIQKQAYRICVDPGNDTARLFYAAIGAKDLNQHWMFWSDIRKIVGK